VQIQVNTDRNIQGDAALLQSVEGIVSHALTRFAEEVTRVEVHLSDVNGAKGGRDIRCVIEVRFPGLQPLTVDGLAEDVERAVRDVVGKAERALETRIGKLGRR
jgi:hypothetical protein